MLQHVAVRGTMLQHVAVGLWLDTARFSYWHHNIFVIGSMSGSECESTLLMSTVPKSMFHDALSLSYSQFPK